jgi:metallo-beta-lactamase family protein
MKIQFLGGAQTVTGSQYLLTVDDKKILLECGVFQGRRRDTNEKNRNFAFDAGSLDAMLLSHAHIDHSGNIPNLVKNGYGGPIFATHATVDLCAIMLRDTAYLQEKDIEWLAKINRKRNEPPPEPLYTMSDVELALASFQGVNYNEAVNIATGVTAAFLDAGHILGSAGILLEISENGKKYRLGFSGDIGRSNMPILRDPSLFYDLDFLIMESTYGNRQHPSPDTMEEDLAQVVRDAAKTGGKIIIPAFAVGRTQLLVYILHKLFDENRIPDIPIFVDSPLARQATEIFRHHPECFDRETNRIFTSNHEDPFGFYRLKYIGDVEESKRLNDIRYPAIIISASGMAEGGRILHHLRNNIEDHRNTVLLVGYAAVDTLARKLMDGEKRVKIFGEEFPVRCRVVAMDVFSAHADRRGLHDYVKFCPPDKLKGIFLVHGESDQSIPLRDAFGSKGFRSVEYPAPGQAFEV